MSEVFSPNSQYEQIEPKAESKMPRDPLTVALESDMAALLDDGGYYETMPEIFAAVKKCLI